MQQRSPAFKAKRNEYIEQVTAFVRDHSFKRVVLLTSADAGLRTDAQISSSSLPFRVLESNPEVQDKVPALEEGPDGVIHGSGLAKRLYIALKEAAPTTLYIMFALEGDNAMDAVAYANILNGIYQILPAQGKHLVSTEEKSSRDSRELCSRWCIMDTTEKLGPSLRIRIESRIVSVTY